MKIRIIARIMLFVLIFANAFILSACPGYGHRTAEFTCYSYNEILEYANQHNKEFKKDSCIFLIFDVDEYDNISTISYVGKTMWYDGVGELFNLSHNDKISSNHWPFAIVGKFEVCSIDKEYRYSIECCGTRVSKSNEDRETTLGIIESNINVYSNNSNSNVSTYWTMLQEDIGMEITITHKHEATQEELDDIVKLFMDNVVIIK